MTNSYTLKSLMSKLANLLSKTTQDNPNLLASEPGMDAYNTQLTERGSGIIIGIDSNNEPFTLEELTKSRLKTIDPTSEDLEKIESLVKNGVIKTREETYPLEVLEIVGKTESIKLKANKSLDQLKELIDPEILEFEPNLDDPYLDWILNHEDLRSETPYTDYTCATDPSNSMCREYD